MPDCNDQYLRYFQRRHVYRRFISNFRNIYIENPPTTSYFLHVQRRSYRHVKLKRQVDLLDAIYERSWTQGLKRLQAFAKSSVLKERKSPHVSMVGEERLQYRKKQDTAILYPENVSSINIDGADKSAFGLPHFVTRPKAVKGRSMNTGLIGLLKHR